MKPDLSPKAELCARVGEVWNVTHGSDTDELEYSEVACVMAKGIETREEEFQAGFKSEQ